MAYQGGYGQGYAGQYNPQQMGGYAPPPGMQMGSGGAPPNPSVSPDTLRWFQMVDRDNSGKINAAELKSALVNGKGENFSDTACKLMIGMFNADKSGTIDVNEFEKLYSYINQWLTVFKTFDRDQSGHIEEAEMSQALAQMGFRFSPEFINFLVTKSDPQSHKQVSVDQFIVLCVQIQRFTEAFRQRDNEMKGIITIGFEEFISIALSCST